MTRAKALELPVLLPGGSECDRCIARLQEELSAVKGVSGAFINNARTTMTVEYDPDLIGVARIEAEAKRVGAEITRRIEHVTLALRDLDCADCLASVERAISSTPGVIWAAGSFASAQMHVEYDRDMVGLPALQATVARHGIGAVPLGRGASDAGDAAWWSLHRRTLTTSAALAFTVAGAVAAMSGASEWAVGLWATAIAVGGWSIARAAAASLLRRSLDMNALMTLAVVGAAACGDWFEGAAVVALFGIGNLIQARTMERTRRSIRGLMDISPPSARVLRDSQEIDVPVADVSVGDVVVIRPGERIPVDGTVGTGASAVNESSLTGESVPVAKAPGSRVFAGTLNQMGALEVRVDRDSQSTALARIIHRIEEAQAQRAPIQQLVDRFARVYTPVVVALAAAAVLAPPLLTMLMHPGALDGAVWLECVHRGLSLLIIACPCALIIATPVAVVAAIGSASRHGALIKGGAYLEEIGRARAIVYDKTGTLTHGAFTLEDVVPLNGLSCAEVIRLVSALESRSEHPLAAAFADRACSEDAGPRPQVSEFEAFPGEGARGVVDGRTYYVGSRSLLERMGVTLDGAREAVRRVEAIGRTVVLLSDERHALGVAVLADRPREGVSQAVGDLETLGVRCQVMLTGDNVGAAHAVASAVGLSDFKAGLLPESKLEWVRKLQAVHGSVAMIGDGVNDAPALAAANVGIAMGAVGSDVAMDTADIALMTEDLRLLPWLVRLSRRTRRIMRQNIAFSVGTKVALLVAAVTIGAPLWLAVAGDVGVSLIVTLNALRLSDRPDASADCGGAGGKTCNLQRA